MGYIFAQIIQAVMVKWSMVSNVNILEIMGSIPAKVFFKNINRLVAYNTLIIKATVRCNDVFNYYPSKMQWKNPALLHCCYSEIIKYH